MWISVRGTDGIDVTVSRCDGTCSTSDPARTDTTETVTKQAVTDEDLLPGRYSLRVSAPLSPERAQARIRITRWIW